MNRSPRTPAIVRFTLAVAGLLLPVLLGRQAWAQG